MRSFMSTTNPLNKKDMINTHPMKIGYQDNTADEILNKVVFYVFAFSSSIIMTLIFGVFNMILIFFMAGIAYFLKTSSEKHNKSIIRDTQDNQDLHYSAFHDTVQVNQERQNTFSKQTENISEIMSYYHLKEENEEDDTPKYDLSTEYTLLSL